MDDPAAVGLGQRPEELQADRDDPRLGKLALAEQKLAQLAAVQQLHPDVHVTIGRPPEVPHPDRVRVGQLRGRPGLPLEALGDFRALQVAGVQQLQGDALPRRYVQGRVHHAKASATERALEPEAFGDHRAGEVFLGGVHGSLWIPVDGSRVRS